MTSTKKTFENLPDEKRKRVLAEATQEFAEHGYHQASINRIVDRLGIAKGSLFKYFGNKQGLFEYLFGHAVAQFKKPLKVIRDANSDTDFFERMEMSLLAGVDFITAHPLVYRIYLKMLFQENFPLRDKFLSEIRQASAKYLRQLVNEAMKSGQIRADIDLEMAIFHLNSVMDHFLQACAVPSLDGGTGLFDADRKTIENKAHALTDFLRHGLGTIS